MKSSPRNYAKALFELTQESSASQAKDIATKFLTDLKNQNMLSKVDTILKEYEVLSDRANGIVRATISSIQKLSKTSLEEVSQLVLKRLGGEKVVWTELIDPSVLGGVRITCGDLIIDMSLANRLADLKAHINE